MPSKDAESKTSSLAKPRVPRQSYSCAECKRLKLKCSRTWPCDSCEKRGCAQICPTGSIKTGKGKRLILADTEELHQRITQLELALAQAHAQTSRDVSAHPLLSSTSTYLYSARDESSASTFVSKALPNDHRGSTGPTDTLHAYEFPPGGAEEKEDVVDAAFGTLTIGRSGESRFVGSFAGSEYLRTEEVNTSALPSRAGSESDGEGARHDPLQDLQNESRMNSVANHAADTRSLALGFRMGGYIHKDEQALVSLRQQLPDWLGEGADIMQAYWDNVNWMYQIIPRSTFERDLLAHAYDLNQPIHPHRLATLFLMLAVGVMFDLHRPPFDNRGDELFSLGQSCLSLIGFERATPDTIRALHLCGTYILNDKSLLFPASLPALCSSLVHLSDLPQQRFVPRALQPDGSDGNGAEIFWPVLGSAIKLAYSIGMHRDGAIFGLSDEETQERRLIWWELLCYDRFQSMCFARPVGINGKCSDTRIPDSNEMKGLHEFYFSKYRIVQLMEKVIDVQTQIAPVPYSTITSLDAELEAFRKGLPDALMPGVPIQNLPFDPSVSPHTVLHRLVVRLFIAQSRLLLSRPFFARALSENIDDPHLSKHGASFVALYTSAQEIVYIVKQLVLYHPSLIARWWFFWFHAFSSACCFAAVVIRCPNSPYASPAFDYLSIVCDIAHAARPGCRAKKGLPVLLRLKLKAQASMQRAGRHGSVAVLPNGRTSVPQSRLKRKSLGDSHTHVSRKSKAQSLGQGHTEEQEMVDEDEDLQHLAGAKTLRRARESNLRRKSSTSSPYALDHLPPANTKPQAGSSDHHPSQSVLSPVSVGSSITLAERPWTGIVPPPPPPPPLGSYESNGQPLGSDDNSSWQSNRLGERTDLTSPPHTSSTNHLNELNLWHPPGAELDSNTGLDEYWSALLRSSSLGTSVQSDIRVPDSALDYGAIDTDLTMALGFNLPSTTDVGDSASMDPTNWTTANASGDWDWAGLFDPSET